MNHQKFPCLPTILPTSVALATLYSVINILPTSAQIVPDNSLGNENSVVTPNVNIRGINSDRIDGGAVRGSNLFHSFQEFNIREGRGAYFSNPDNIINILTRVTGGNISEILGTLGVLGNANLFLINPAGIVFGPNARLDVGGSFFATTADGILFENGFEFAASNPEAPPLLTINMPLGLNIRENPGTIVNQTLPQLVDRNGIRPNGTPSGLYVPPEETIALIGGEVRFESGVIASPGSRLELGGLSEPGIVELNPDGSLNFPLNVQRANVLLTNGAVASVVGNPGGNIGINARNLEISGGSQVTNGVAEVSGLLSIEDGESLDTEPSQAGDIRINATESVRLTDQNSAIGNIVLPNSFGNAGNIDIQTNLLSISDGTFISTATFGQGDGGDLTVTATDAELVGSKLGASVEQGATGNGGTLTIETQNLSVREGAQIFTGTSGQGEGGNLTVTATNVEVVGRSADGQVSSALAASVQPGAIGNSGTLTINTQNLSVREGAQISTGTFGNGDGGNLTVTATDVELVGTSSDGQLPSGLFASVEQGATGNGGTLTLNTQRLSVREGAQIQTGTSGNGDGGNLTVTANDVELVGSGSGLAASVQRGATGNGGTLTVDTQRLSVRDGAQISASTFGNGDGGNLTVTATDVELVGSGSQLGASVEREATGNGGTLTINTQNLLVRDGAVISTDTFGNGNGGNLTVTANDVEVFGDGSALFADVNSQATGNGGTLTVNTQNLLVRDGAVISTDTFGNGNGGNLTVTANDVEVFGDGSALFADVNSQATGNAGTLTLNTQRLLVRDGAVISASTFGNGNGGNLTVTANDVELVGSSADGQVSSGLRSSVQRGGVGNGGTLTLNTQNLSVRDGALIFTGTVGEGDGGNLTITANNVELVGGGSQLGASVEREATGNGGTLTINTQRLSVREGAQIQTGTRGIGDGGNLTITANNVELVGGGSQLGASVQPDATGNGGTLTVNTQNLLVRDGAVISTDTFGNGNGGNLTVTANDVEVFGDGSALFADVNSQATGNGGTLTVNTQNLLVRDGAVISTDTFGNGNGGNLTVTANDVEVFGDGSALFADVNSQATGNAGTLTLNTQRLLVRDGAVISASTFGNGNGGNLTVTANDVELVGSSADGQVSSGLRSSVQRGGVGNGGTLTLNTQNLSVRDGALIFTGTVGEGDGGNLTITANNVELVGGGSQLGASVVQGATGNGGTLTLNTQRLSLLEGAQISTATFGNGNGGNLTVTANDVELVGTSADGQFPSGLFASALFSSTGRAGTLTVNAENLTVRDGANIDVRSESSEPAGNLVINAPSIFLDNRASLNANTTAGQGNIILNTSDLRLRRNSNITTNATGEATGGNIEINTDTLVAIENSDISANAQQAFGGRVIINANAIFGTQFRTQPTGASDITATSELGPQFSGTVQLNTEIDPSSGLVDLPQRVVDPAALIAQDPCKQRGDSQFIITGRGGIAFNPIQDLFAVPELELSLIEPVTPSVNRSSQRRQQQSKKRDNNTVDSRTIVPARGWIRDEKGDVILVGYDPTKTGVQRQPQPLPNQCNSEE
ncbi:filamentous hemagglutinin N-terminal domain-containing protein [Limnoraphis robusta Tam1]|uniref:beta strand repeat-containing protein n=1 Tax=Limnoraphis robusta TaxID=1118279 RepID=UPI002B20D36F|nr:filamentous hemagglutinin N-terminal domain-containing protein [Limnoraphis robusta]MEA5542206.1 filamentous hemagglutinin N-terminal domain-containing protein [Limnoraphis robusta Tam1]